MKWSFSDIVAALLWFTAIVAMAGVLGWSMKLWWFLGW